MGTKTRTTSSLLSEYFKGKINFCWSFMDHTGGLVIVEVEKIQEAEEVSKNDPAVLEGKFEYVVHPWEPFFIGSIAKKKGVMSYAK